MKRFISLAVALLCALSFAWAGPGAAAWPAAVWETATPESVGIDSAKVTELLEGVRRQGWRVDSLQVVRHGRLVVDAYVYPYAPGHLHDLRSVTKSVTSSLVGLSIAQGKWAGLQVPVLSLFPGRDIKGADERKQAMTLGDLVDMRSGLSWNEDYTGNPDSSFVQMAAAKDWTGFVLDQPMSSDPGVHFNYSGGNMNLLATLVGGAWGQRASYLAWDRLFQPIGIARYQWNGTDAQGHTIGESTLVLDPRDMARLGLLWLHDGVWKDTRLLPEGWTARLLEEAQPTDGPSLYKRGFWIDSRRTFFGAQGRHGQNIVVDPARDLVIVLTGKIGDAEDSPMLGLVKRIRAMAAGTETLPENPTAQAALEAELKVLAGPAGKASAPAKLPDGWIGRTWKLEPNPLELVSLRLEPDPADAGALFLDVAFEGGAVRYACGLDGAFRFTVDARAEFPTRALKGKWVAPGVLEIEEQALESSVYATYRLAVEGAKLTVKYDNSQYLHGLVRSVGD